MKQEYCNFPKSELDGGDRLHVLNPVLGFRFDTRSSEQIQSEHLEGVHGIFG